MSAAPAASPAELLQGHLDRLGRAIMDDDWPAFVAGIALPLAMTTGTALIMVEDEERLRQGFDEFRGMLAGLRVTDYVRLVEAAEAVGPDAIEGRYVTNLLAVARRVVPPYEGAMTIRRGDGGGWRATHVRTGLANARWPIAIPTPLPPEAG